MQHADQLEAELQALHERHTADMQSSQLKHDDLTERLATLMRACSRMEGELADTRCASAWSHACWSIMMTQHCIWNGHAVTLTLSGTFWPLTAHEQMNQRAHYAGRQAARTTSRRSSLRCLCKPQPLSGIKLRQRRA
jgi:hypothetical protein